MLKKYDTLNEPDFPSAIAYMELLSPEYKWWIECLVLGYQWYLYASCRVISLSEFQQLIEELNPRKHKTPKWITNQRIHKRKTREELSLRGSVKINLPPRWAAQTASVNLIRKSIVKAYDNQVYPLQISLTASEYSPSYPNAISYIAFYNS